MTNAIALKGFIRDIRYSPQLVRPLPVYPWSDFDINRMRGFGLITFEAQQSALAISKWVSPKRTRSYPFARIYNTYGQNTKCITVIPIIKDEGLRGDNDRINAMTFSWMSLLNIYIVLAWYDEAVSSQVTGKITAQRFNSEAVRARISEIGAYRASALHWNTSHFINDFSLTYRQAVASYQHLQTRTGIAMHSADDHFRMLARFQNNGVFDLARYKEQTLLGSSAAAHRETGVIHAHERLDEGAKYVFRIENYLGGEYYLTADEIFWKDDSLIIQESKHSARDRLPKFADIQDGLFKLILFTNLDRLLFNDKPVLFQTQLKLTGALSGSLRFPAEANIIDAFCRQNTLTPSQRTLLTMLDRETRYNANLSIILTGIT